MVYHYLAFVKRLKNIRLAHLYAVDTCKGDKQAGYYSNEVYNQVSEHVNIIQKDAI